MAKLNWFLTLKNMSKFDETAKTLLDSINNAESDEIKEKAKAEAKEYVESFNDSTESEEPTHVETKSEVETAEKELESEITIDVDSDEPVGERPQPIPSPNSALVERIRRRQKIAEENMRKRRNQPVTFSEQKAAAIEKGKEVIRRNNEMAERRKALREKIEQQQAERKAHNEKNMVGLYTILLREIKLNIRLEIICKNHGFTRQDLEKLKENNPSAWANCLAERPVLEKEMEMYIK